MCFTCTWVQRSYRLRTLIFTKRWARTSGGINHHTLDFRGAVLTYAGQESNHRFTCNLSECLCAAQAKMFMPWYEEEILWCCQLYLLNIFQLCSCTGYSQGCWKQVLHLKVIEEVGRWKTTEGGSGLKIQPSCSDVAILHEQKMQEADMSLLPGGVVEGEEQRLFYCKYIHEAWK